MRRIPGIVHGLRWRVLWDAATRADRPRSRADLRAVSPPVRDHLQCGRRRESGGWNRSDHQRRRVWTSPVFVSPRCVVAESFANFAAHFHFLTAHFAEELGALAVGFHAPLIGVAARFTCFPAGLVSGAPGFGAYP